MVRARRRLAAFLTAAVLAFLGACTGGSAAPAGRGIGAGPVTTVAQNLDVPWAVAFLPDGSALVTERQTAKVLKLTPDHQVTTVMTVPGVVAQGEGGLLGIAASPRYADDGLVFVYYTAADDNRIARLRIGETPQPIVTGIPKAIVHNGGRLGFGPDGYLYASTGDSTNRGLAQNTSSLAGKILRMTPDGQPAPGNPFGNLVYSYGHRNVQGFGWTSNGTMYATEFGQNAWDELNRIEPGKNYGWPAVEGRADDPKYTDPVVQWHTDVASCSGLAITGSAGSATTGPSGAPTQQIVIGCLRGARLYVMDAHPDGSVGTPRGVFQDTYGRIRAVVVAPDGQVWFTTSNRDGRGSPESSDDRILAVTLTP